MEMLFSPDILLLNESTKRQSTFSTEDGEVQLSSKDFCSWFGFDSLHKVELTKDVKLDAKENCKPIKKRSTSHHQRFPWQTKSLNDYDVKFEHFPEASQYIEKYRRVKNKRQEERCTRLLQRQEKNGHVFTNYRTEKQEINIVSLSPKNNYDEATFSSSSNMDYTNPSIPQSGCFVGRKWIHPKDCERVWSRNIGVDW